MFNLRSSHRRRLSTASAQVDDTQVSQSIAGVTVDMPPRGPRGFFDLPYEIREQ